MRIILTKATEIRGRKFPVGQKMDVSPEYFEKHLKDSAEEWFGELRVKPKPKIDLSKLKTK